MDGLARFMALLAGVLLTFITLMTCGSIIGRETVGRTIVGDFELTGVATGAAIALFLPYCQARRGNIIVDFFTSRCRPGTIAGLDRLGAFTIAAVMALMAWRTTLGGLRAWDSQTGTMMLGFPEWIVFAAMVPPLALTMLIALHQTVFGFSATPSDELGPAAHIE